MSHAQTGTDRPDTHDMVIVHRVYRRVMRDAPDLVRRVEPGDTTRAERLAAHLTEIHTALHHHHAAEDELLWPVLLERVSADREVVVRMTEQHARVAELLEKADAQVPQ